VKSISVTPPSDRLPVTGDLTLICGVSLAVALTMAVASVAGLACPGHLYPTVELRRSFMPNDVVHLTIGLPSLLGAMWLSRRGQLLGLLLWPGTLLYVVYNAIAYALALPLNLGLLLWFLLLTSSAYAIIALVAAIDGQAVKQKLKDTVPERMAGAVLVILGERMAGAVLVILGAAFFLRVIGVMVQALIGSTALVDGDLAVLASDLLTAPAWVIGGIFLWRREPLGYAAGTALLFLISTLFVGLIVFMLVQPLLTYAPFRLVDVLVIFVMGLITFIPTGLFVRGVMSKH